ncbi:unnamed protein product [Cyprideis torosa]|uniref:Methionine aminopeptidase n=1 Tax=Cyprideis torosa TaxID=163714 RepID=A0A7R8ZUP4_9CRUS|nr:unnamed protein product [Cyprideis torosa]CAG0901156.1 unnamed protein product [Cyprideis torosa]
MVHLCENSACESEASLQCPTCLKLQLEPSFFCGQACFKSSWAEHKQKHAKKLALLQPYNPWPNYSFTGMLRPSRQSPRRTVPDTIPRPDYATHPKGISDSERAMRNNTTIHVLDDEEIEAMRVACRLGREVLDEGAKAVAPGVTTDEIDRIVHEACVDRECYPSPLNYYRFPKSCCTSVNEVICHGIPDLRPLQDTDIINIDVTVFHQGFHGDLNETLFVSDNVPAGAKKLVQTTWECLEKAIQLVRPGVRYRDIGKEIQKHASSQGFSVVKTYCGHGIHRLFHTAPSVPHYGKNKAVGVMKPGHVFTIEPMINEGVWQDTMWPDDWTAVTVDGKLSAQFEQTLLVTETGCDVLTRRLDRDGQPWFMDSPPSPTPS